MNVLDYASIEASQRLVDNGIVLDTEVFWYKDPGEEQTNGDFIGEKDWELHRKYLFHPRGMQNYPAPSMAEVLREFTKKYSAQQFAALIRKRFEPSNEKGVIFYMYLILTNVNEAINLLIWVSMEAIDE